MQVQTILSPQETMIIHRRKWNFPVLREMLAPLLRQQKWEKDVSVFPFRMDLGSIVLYLHMNGRDISDDLVTTLHEDALAYSAMTLWPRQERLPRFSEPSHNLAKAPQVNETDEVVLSALTFHPFRSVRDIAQLTCISCSTVSSQLRCIPLVLPHEQKHNRVRQSHT
jgi:hypothetical protein